MQDREAWLAALDASIARGVADAEAERDPEGIAARTRSLSALHQLGAKC